MALTGLTFIYNPAIHGAVNRFYYDHEHDEAAKRRFQGTLNTFLILWGFLLTAGLWLTGPRLFDAILPGLPFDPYGELIVWTAFLGMLSVIPKATWTAAERAKPFVGVSMLASFVNIFGAIGLLALAEMGVIGLFWAKLISCIIVAIPFVHYLWRKVGFALHVPDLVTALKFSLPLVPHLVAHWVLSMADRLLIEHYLGLKAVGIYGSAYVFTEAVAMMAHSMNRAWVPLLNRAYGDEAQHPLIGRTITYFMLTVGGTSGLLSVFAPTIVRTLYADNYAEAADVASILAMGGFFLGLYLVYVAGLFYFKKNNAVPFITVISGAINVGLNILWIPTMGIRGAAWATLIGYIALALGVRFACRRITRLPFETGRLVRFFLVLVAVVAAGLALDGLLPWYWEIPAKLGVVLAGPLTLYLWGFWTPEELTWFKTKLKGAARRP
jgi:O-antigen/teichoic acid export membrane protein